MGTQFYTNGVSVFCTLFLRPFVYFVTIQKSLFVICLFQLPRVLPRYAKMDDAVLESLNDISTGIRALSPVISPPRLRNSLNADPSTKIQEYVER